MMTDRPSRLDRRCIAPKRRTGFMARTRGSAAGTERRYITPATLVVRPSTGHSFALGQRTRGPPVRLLRGTDMHRGNHVRGPR